MPSIQGTLKNVKKFANRAATDRIHASTYGQPLDSVTEGAVLDTTAEALDVTYHSDYDWEVKVIAFDFSGVTSRDYSAKIVNGIRIIPDRNDYLYFQIEGTTLWQKISLDEGFYTASEAASHLQDQLDADPAFTSAGITFTVTFDNTTKKFTITPSSGDLRYVQTAPVRLSERDSLAGHLFGLTEDSAFGATVESDTARPSLGQEIAIIDETGAAHTNRYHDDPHPLSSSQGLRLQSSIAAITVETSVVYEKKLTR